MTCLNPPALTDRQLMTYNDGEAPSDLIAHLNLCLHCRQRAAQIALEEAQLRHRLTYQTACPSLAELEQYYLGELAPAHEDAIARHLATACPQCRQVVARIMNQLSALVSLTVPIEVPAPMPMARTSSPPRVSLLGRMKNQLEALVAELVTPPNLAPALRGEQEKGLLIFRADKLELRLDIQPDIGSDRKVLVGQVKALGSEHSTALAQLEVDLYQGDDLVATLPITGKRGRFQSAALAPGRYQLVVRDAHRAILIPEFDV